MKRNDQTNLKLKINDIAESEVSNDLLLRMERIRFSIIRAIASRSLVNSHKTDGNSIVVLTS